MSTFMLKNTALKFTPVSNVFIEKYMPKARGEFIKVYLLMLKYNISSEPGVNSSVLANSLNLLESDVMNALNYWNEEGVIKLVPIDKMNNYSIEFLSLDDDITETSDNDDINLLDALNNSDTTDMLRDIEKILSRTLSSKEMEIYLGWQKEFNFSSELILLLIEYCASRGKTNFRYIEKVAEAWSEKNVRNIEDAQKLIRQNEDKWVKIRQILSHLGMRNTDIMKPQEDMLEKWLFTYKFEMELIKNACDRSFERLNHANFKYIDGILTNWYNNNIKTLEDVAKDDKKHKKSNQNSSNNNFNKNNSNQNKTLRFNDFKQREYDYDSLEKKLLGWDSDD
ncbi:DnaD domain protein [Clostridium chrysemydis]|uniref:DnaD domain protein n=1 Tax=Clostridium chrysemydis TaxID=2665504 RepID=UPI0018837260|nr:DnaD domain protein [Clostridium chrysemydis]